MIFEKDKIIEMMDDKGWLARTRINNKFYYSLGYTKSDKDEVLYLKKSFEKLGVRSSEPRLKTNRYSTWEMKIKLGDYLKQGFYFNNERKSNRFEEYIDDFGKLQRLDGPSLYERRVFDRRFFKTWSKEMAYVLGFLTADGWVYHEEGRSYQIGFSSKDYEQLVMINNLLQSNANITRKTKDESHWYEIRIGSKKMFDDLSKYGIHQNKSLDIEMPDIPEEYLWDYIRGYFDGDGCVCCYEQNNKINYGVTFTCGSKKYLESLQTYLIYFNLYKKSSSRNCYELRGYQKATKFLFENMYNSPMYMKRKYNKFIECLSIKERDIV